MTANGFESTIGHHSESALLLISHAKGGFLKLQQHKMDHLILKLSERVLKKNKYIMKMHEITCLTY